MLSAVTALLLSPSCNGIFLDSGNRAVKEVFGTGFGVAK
jgi:hypothetical protein